jgi:uncharacterized protein with HEPN domain
MARPVGSAVRHMLDHIEQALSFVQGMDFELYVQAVQTQRAVERCLEIISEASRDIPEELKRQYSEIPWADVAGIGNVLRHEYHHVDNQIIWQTATLRLEPLGDVLRVIEASLPADEQ